MSAPYVYPFWSEVLRVCISTIKMHLFEQLPRPIYDPLNVETFYNLFY